MLSKDEIREEGLRIVQGHLGGLVKPSQLKLEFHPKEGEKWAWWSIDLDGEMLCYIGVGQQPGHSFITFTVETRDGIGESKRTWRYGSYEDRVKCEVEAPLAAATSDRLFADQIRYAAKGIAGS